MEISIFWFRRDLRLEDNVALFKALSTQYSVLPIFIFDTDITDDLDSNDPRINFIYNNLNQINKRLKLLGSGLKIFKGKPLTIWNELLNTYTVKAVYINKDYEPYAIQRDLEIKKLLQKKEIELFQFKDQVIFEENEVLKDDGKPYTVYTPYKNKWLAKLKTTDVEKYPSEKLLENSLKFSDTFPSITSIGFQESSIKVQDFSLKDIDTYEQKRDFPFIDKTSYLSPHLRFGTVSIRSIMFKAKEKNPTFLSELIWREFFMQILFHFPRVIHENFKVKYNAIHWRNDEKEFEKWCAGETGYPMVDAGMRQLNQTGYMHNRVRMITAGFLCKHLLIDWKWGEAYFAKKLLDYELSSNNGNWQWAAGTGCDAAPYFRVFNPTIQLKKFDTDFKYVRKWIENFDDFTYPKPIVDHKMARERAIETYKVGLENYLT